MPWCVAVLTVQLWITHVDGQLSPLAVFPSSQVSPVSTLPLPHRVVRQFALQPCRPSLSMPRSHSSPASRTPLPQQLTVVPRTAHDLGARSQRICPGTVEVVVLIEPTVVVVVDAGGSQAQSAVHPAPSPHGAPSHCSPLAGSTMPSPQRVNRATNVFLSFDFWAMSVPFRVVQVGSRVPVSFTLPLRPAQDGHTAMTVVPCLVAFSFACTGLQAFPIDIWGP